MKPAPRIPVTLITGYLGSGKTTILNRLLATARGRRFAVLVNDFGAINIDAAKQGLDIFAEHTVDARANPGKHPNIDRLLTIAENGGEMLRIKHVFAIDDELPA